MCAAHVPGKRASFEIVTNRSPSGKKIESKFIKRTALAHTRAHAHPNYSNQKRLFAQHADTDRVKKERR